MMTTQQTYRLIFFQNMKSQKNGAMLCSRSVPQHDKQKILVPLGNQKLEKINLQQPHYAMF
jgi:hypothetical protein